MNWLANLPKKGSEAWNRIKALGPFVIAQSEKLSEAFARHQGRMAQIEMTKEFVRSEISLRGEIRKNLHKRLLTCSQEDRVRLEADLEHAEQELRRLAINQLSLNYCKEEKQEEAVPPREIADHWLDQFQKFARDRNEDWRAELLARALAEEVANASSVSTRVLWSIGTLSSDEFSAFSKLLNCCFWPVDTLAPFLPQEFLKSWRIAPDLHVGNLIFSLSGAGVLSTGSSYYGMGAGTKLRLRAGTQQFTISFRARSEIRGVILNPIGAQLALFHEPKFSQMPLSRIEEWIALLGDRVEVECETLPENRGAGNSAMSPESSFHE
jgi:hypothetical protein